MASFEDTAEHVPNVLHLMHEHDQTIADFCETELSMPRSALGPGTNTETVSQLDRTDAHETPPRFAPPPGFRTPHPVLRGRAEEAPETDPEHFSSEPRTESPLLVALSTIEVQTPSFHADAQTLLELRAAPSVSTRRPSTDEARAIQAFLFQSFRPLPPRLIKTLFGELVVLETRGERVLAERGDPVAALWVVYRGRVRGPGAAVHERGSLLGLDALYTHRYHSTRLYADQPITLLAVPRALALSLYEHHPEFRRFVEGRIAPPEAAPAGTGGATQMPPPSPAPRPRTHTRNTAPHPNTGAETQIRTLAHPAPSTLRLDSFWFPSAVLLSLVAAFGAYVFWG